MIDGTHNKLAEDMSETDKKEKKIEIKEYYPIARIGDEIKIKESKQKVIRIIEDGIYTDEDNWKQWNSNQEITLFSQAKPSWDNLRAGDWLVDKAGEIEVGIVLNHFVGFCDDGEVVWETKLHLKNLGYIIKDTRQDKGENDN